MKKILSVFIVIYFLAFRIFTSRPTPDGGVMKYEDKLIEHLSREIETHTTNMMTFRARINFAVFVGPFVILGSLIVGAKGIPRRIDFDGWTIAAVILLLMSYILMACVCATIERQMWKKCNVWRGTIRKLVMEESSTVTADEINFREGLRLGYTLVYIAMIVAFACAAWIVSRVNITP